MVQNQLVDTRNKEEKENYPWWWRETCFVKELGGLIITHPAYCYELGRRYQILANRCESSIYRPLTQILKSLQDKEGKIKFQLMYCFEVDAIDSAVLIDPCIEKLNKEGVEEFNANHAGSWVETNAVAWNLECPWKRVMEVLKAQFEDQQTNLGIKSSSQARKIQKPHWQNLEEWDCWTANLDIPERFPAGGLDHKRKVDEITRLAKKHAGAAERFANVAIEMSKA